MVLVAAQRGRNAGTTDISLRGLQYLIARIAITASAIAFLYLTIQLRSPTKVSSSYLGCTDSRLKSHGMLVICFGGNCLDFIHVLSDRCYSV